MEKKKGYILYFDILGYKNILKNNTAEENDKIANIICQFSDYYTKASFALGYGSNFDKNKFFGRSFSYNFLFIYEIDRDDYMGLSILQLVATRIQYQFLNVGLLTRGSITYGEILENDNLVFGTGLIRACELEDGHRMPNIVIDSALRDVFEQNNSSFKEEVDLFDVWPNSKLDYQDCVSGIKNYLYYLNKMEWNDNILEKIRWVINKFNEYFEKEINMESKLVVNIEINKVGEEK